MRKFKHTTLLLFIHFLLFIPLLNGCVNTQSQNSTNSSSSSVHTHTYSDKMLYDDTHHWYEVTCGHDDAANKEFHSYGDWYEVEAPTCETNGSKRRDCTICDYYEIKIIEATHSYSDDYYIDENYHWSDITCEHSDAPSNKENHNYVNGICTVCEYTKQTNDYITFTLSDDGTYYIVSLCNAEATNIVIPHFYNDLPVKEIGDFAFTSCNKLEKIFIPNTTIIVGSYSFSDCTSLKNITFESNSQLTTIKVGAFYNCNSLTSITVPFIGQYADGSGATHFGYIFGAETNYKQEDYVPSSLKEAIITGGTSIGAYAFDDCHSLISITIPNSVTSIGESAFYNCSSLTSISIPYIVTSIGESAFYNCGCLRSITIPNSVTSIGNYAFKDCSSLIIYCKVPSKPVGWDSSWNFSNRPVNWGINENTFIEKDGIQYVIENGEAKVTRYVGNDSEVIIPSAIEINGTTYNVTNIGNDAFKNCRHLTTINFRSDSQLTGIGAEAFFDCSSLTSIKIPNSVTNIGEDAFHGCSSLILKEYKNACYLGNEDNPYLVLIKAKDNSIAVCIINKNTLFISSGAFSSCIKLSSIVFEEGSKLTSIGNSAFESCSSLSSIEIPNSVTSIRNNTFYNCKSLTSITIPNSATSIGDSAFYGCDSLTSISIPNSVTSIGECAFYDCDSLTSISIPNSVTSIGDSAFYGCDSLTIISIPNSVTSIGECAFCDCDSLTSISIPNSVTSIGDSAFSYCDHLSIYCEVSSKPSGWSSSWNPSNRPVYWGINENIFIEKDGIQYVIENGKAKVTRYVGNDSEVTIPSAIEINGATYNVTCIDANAFQSCSSLSSIEIPNSVTSIGANAFQSCSSLSSIEIPNSITSIGDSAFSNCDSLTSISIPNSVTSIGAWAFHNCSSLKSITIPNSVSSIGASAFSRCFSLKSITIPNSVTSIGANAFYACSSLTIYCEVSSKPSGWNSIWNIANSPVYWGINENTFIEKDGIQYVIKNGEAKVTRYVGNDSEVVIPSTIEINGTTYNVTSIGDSAFSNCDSLTSISIPNSITSIGDSAFYDCDSLTSISIPNSVTSIGAWAFHNCYSLTSITIPNSVTSIGECAFRSCSSLTIYCEVPSKPSGWNSIWNYSNRPVYWAGEWEYDADGNPTPII